MIGRKIYLIIIFKSCQKILVKSMEKCKSAFYAKTRIRDMATFLEFFGHKLDILEYIE